MLDLSADAAGNVKLGTYRHARLANLAVMVGKAGIHGGAAGAYLGVQLLGQFERLAPTSACSSLASSNSMSKPSFEPMP